MNKGTHIVKNSILALLIAMFSFFVFFEVLNVCFNLCYIDTQVRGFSMFPTINSSLDNSQQKGDTIYINKYSQNIDRDDIVVASVEWHTDYIVKRMVALPGDRIQIKDHSTYYGLYVNDKLLYIREKKGVDTADIKTESIAYYAKYISFINNPENAKYVWTINSEKYIVMPEGEYFLMGDNWGYTTDSMEHGPIKKHQIVGKVDAILPQSHINFFTPTWFMLKLVFCN